MKHIWVSSAVGALLAVSCCPAHSAPTPPAGPVNRGTNVAAMPTVALGEWDGVTASAHLQGPYEDQSQSYVPFGIVSYYNQPWRSYMDTWPASHFEGFMGVNWNIDARYAEPVCQLLSESGIRTVRYEIGWGNLDWSDDLPKDSKDRLNRLFAVFHKYGIRPMILLNAHHGAPCPLRDVPVQLALPAKKGDRTLKLVPGTELRLGYTGPMDANYIAAYPLVTALDADGTAHLSAPLGEDLPAGKLNFKELKYQPFQGPALKDGTAIPAARATFDGWLKYVASVATAAREALGTAGQADAGFDLEVWNEQTFGSNFLGINNYYEPKLEFAGPYTYRKTRPRLPSYRPDAKLDFEQRGAYCILPMTIDYIDAHRDLFPGVSVVSGFANQWPWDNGTDLWDGQAGFSRHYYTGGWQDCSPENPLRNRDIGTIDAQGHFDGKKDNRDWQTIVPDSAFAPIFRVGFPEFLHSGFKTESLSRDVLPDSLYVYFNGHGRYTNNGDYKPARLWETEVNYDRSPFWDGVFKETGAARDDPRALALDEFLADKMMLRQYLFHNHKGLDRIYLFAVGENPYSLGMLPHRFYDALAANNMQLNSQVRATVPAGFGALKWLTRQMDAGEPIAAPRPLQVRDLIEYKPRLLFAGDGTAAHPDRHFRDQFAFLPYQLSNRRFFAGFYVVTVDATRAWDKSKGALDPARYAMPPQWYDVMIGNVRGRGAHIDVYDPLTGNTVPAEVVSSDASTLTVRLEATDYPRFLTIDEAASGPQILDPSVTVDAANRVVASWNTNLPGTAWLTYGNDWPNRSANRIDLAPGQKSYSIALPAGLKGVVAVRIHQGKDGIEDVWPRWDEDPAGQIVLPGGNEKAAASPAAAPLDSLASWPEIHVPERTVPLPTGEAIHSMVANASAQAFHILLPVGVSLAGPPDDREGTLGSGQNTIALSLRYVAGGSTHPLDQLPIASPVDEVAKCWLILPSGQKTMMADYAFNAAAHPGMTNLSQRYVLFLAGKDLLCVALSGTPSAFKAAKNSVDSILGSITVDQ